MSESASSHDARVEIVAAAMADHDGWDWEATSSPDPKWREVDRDDYREGARKVLDALRVAGCPDEGQRAKPLEADEALAAMKAIPEADVPDPLVRQHVAVKALRAAREVRRAVAASLPADCDHDPRGAREGGAGRLIVWCTRCRLVLRAASRAEYARIREREEAEQRAKEEQPGPRLENC